jgi:hypothetical protein
MYHKKTLFTLIVVGLLSGCSTTKVFNKNELMNMKNVSKNHLLDKLAKKYQTSITIDKQKQLNTEFYEKYFRPWRIDKLPYSKKDASWGVRVYGKSRSLYGVNKRVLSRDFLAKFVDNSNFDRYNTLKRKAITLKNTSLRVLPTDKPLFKNFDKAGEGYPFDYNQNSLLFVNHPLIVSHLSKDKAWAFVESPFTSGWVKSNDIAYVDNTFIQKFKNAEFATMVKDNMPIYDKKGNFLFYAKVATSFPIENETSNYYLVYTAKRDANSNAVLRTVKLEKSISAKKPIKLSQENITKISKEFLGEKYGWGGSFMNRDCSAMTRDFFAPFGIWIPRNSKSQAHYSKYIDLSKMDKEKKEKYIIKHAKPFETTIYMRGHIMLYIGHIDNRVYAMHNMWGIRTKDDSGKITGRKIVGQTVVTSLHLGEGLDGVEESALFINKILGISLVTEKK